MGSVDTNRKAEAPTRTLTFFRKYTLFLTSEKMSKRTHLHLEIKWNLLEFIKVRNKKFPEIYKQQRKLKPGNLSCK